METHGTFRFTNEQINTHYQHTYEPQSTSRPDTNRNQVGDDGMNNFQRNVGLIDDVIKSNVFQLELKTVCGEMTLPKYVICVNLWTRSHTEGTLQFVI
uniref:Bm8629 n=1 Tax=Brugia malayi TaxID=6279 RepID=A0A1I9G7B7_BRUMA|nr:Bm8629 [Brugia malayi]